MKIEKLTLKNFRCYADAKITFDPKVTVLVAANGQGKTSVLDALRIAIWHELRLTTQLIRFKLMMCYLCTKPIF